MRKPVLMMLLLLLLTAPGCTTPEAPPPATPDRGHASHSTPDVVGYGREVAVRAEPVWRATLGELLPDPEGGVWSLQDGALFRFDDRPGDWMQRTTYGRPGPSSSGSGELVWLEPGKRMAGQVDIVRLVRLHPDGTLDELGPARSPEGIPFRLLNQWDRQLYLWDAQGTWYTPDPAGGGFRPVLQQPDRYVGVVDAPESVREALSQAAGGEVGGFSAQIIGDTAYGLVRQMRLFIYDVKSERFTWVGDPIDGGTLRLVGTFDGQILADVDGKRLVLIDPQTGARLDQGESDAPGPLFHLGDGLVYKPLNVLLDLRTGQERRLTLPRLAGGITAAVLVGDGRLIVGTGHGGQLISIDLATGAGEDWGRPIPQLGQETGEEVAPVTGLALGGDGLLYASIGTGARGREESHLVRMDPATGQVLEQIYVREGIRSLRTGADGQVYAVLNGRVAVVQSW